MTGDPRASLEQIPPQPLPAGTPSSKASGGPVAPSQGSGEQFATSGEIWLHRAFVLMLVLVCAVVGVLLVILPWAPAWTDNRLLWGYPKIRSLLATGFVRGLCSGLGILDLWIGFAEAVHYHEGQRPSK